VGVSVGILLYKQRDYRRGKYAVSEEFEHLVGLISTAAWSTVFVAKAGACERLQKQAFILEGVADLRFYFLYIFVKAHNFSFFILFPNYIN
jgi:hypothetical protein